MRIGDVMRTEEVLERYRDVLLADFELRDQLGDFAPRFFDGVDVTRYPVLADHVAKSPFEWKDAPL